MTYPCRQNLMVVQESLHVDKVSWLRTEAELSKPGLTWNSATQPTIPAGPTSTTTVLHAVSCNTVVVDVGPAGNVGCVAEFQVRPGFDSSASVLNQLALSPCRLSCTTIKFWRAFNSLSRELRLRGSTGLKTRVMNNLLATFCIHFTRTLFIADNSR